MSYLPLVGLPADTYESPGFLYHSIGDKSVRAVAEVANCSPVMIPAIMDALHLDALLDRFDGILMTGAVSNVHPPHYGEQPSADHEPYDHARDQLTLRLITRTIERGIPLFCICRGFQELNVVMGGTLETELQRNEGRLDHRAPKHDDVDVRYAPAHLINIRPGGMLERILGKRETMVNSIHRQGIKRLAPGLSAEATAPDGSYRCHKISPGGQLMDIGDLTIRAGEATLLGMPQGWTVRSVSSLGQNDQGQTLVAFDYLSASGFNDRLDCVQQ